jgi:hypothetical protein
MTGLPRLQADFQEYVLRFEGPAQDLVIGTERANAATRLGIYTEAYRLRLLEALDANYPVLHQWIGAQPFRDLGGAYIDVCPSNHYNIRYFGDQLPRFLTVVEPYCNTPALSEMATLEWALTVAFDAADCGAITTEQIAAIPADLWPSMKITLHPSVQRLDLHWNVPALWKAIHEHREYSEPDSQSIPIGWVIWRQQLSPYFRSLDVDEAWSLDAARRGEDFSAICDGLCEWIDAQHVATHAAGLLKRWVTDGLIGNIATSNK